MKSMTGYATATATAQGVSLNVEIRSVNQRFFDLKVHAPREYLAHEARFRRAVAAHVDRGRVELFVARNSLARQSSITLQHDVAAGYVAAWKELRERFDLAGDLDLSLFAGRSDIFQMQERPVEVDDEIEQVFTLLEQALVRHNRARVTEGRHLAKDMSDRVKRLRAIRRELTKRAKGLVPVLRARLEARLSSLLGRDTVDPARLAQETAVLADRADVTEELVRFQAHLTALGELLVSDEPVGKRIDFVLQEINRELNTIGSKANDLEVTNLVLDGKGEVEKVREQIQNVE
ncbi:MAG: hypothetical protein ACI8TX_001318 [Hyphomicrobiaceae bacterium]|jgi:uncharacterized protein (TIGR00255 family)